MSLTNSRLAYLDCVELWDAALSDPQGVRIDFGSRAKAEHFVARLHQCRKLDRQENRSVHAPGTRLYGKSAWDVLKCTLRPGTIDGLPVWWLYIERHAVDLTGFQRLSELQPEAEAQTLALPQAEPLRLPAPVGIKRRA